MRHPVVVLTMERKLSFVWFRQDLRLHDNEAMHEALSQTDEVIYIYVFDQRLYEEQTMHGFKRTGPHRARFIKESVENLRENLRAKGADLTIRYGLPEEEIFKLAREHKPSWVFCNRERTRHQVMVQDDLERNLWSIGCEIRYSRGKMLYYTKDLPFPITHSPDHFSQFRKEVDRYVPIRTPLENWESLPGFHGTLDYGSLPSDDMLGASGNKWIAGGESAGLQWLEEVLSDPDHPFQSSRTISDDRHGLLMSPYLSQGCVSPKMMFQQVQAQSIYRDQQKKLLQLRDFLRLLGKKYGDHIYAFQGIGNPQKLPSKQVDKQVVLKWVNGETGYPLIDALMKALQVEGYIPFKGRELVAMFFVYVLKQRWTVGAEYFQHILIDYDPCSTWCSWQYIAGVGTSGFDIRSTDFQAKSLRLDPSGKYATKWLPTLSGKKPSEIYS